VRAELRDLYRHNRALRRARSGPVRRTLVNLVSGVKLSQLLSLYVLIWATSLLGEWGLTAYRPCLLPNWGTFELGAFVKDINSYFVAGQVGILGIVSVAVGVVTLLMQRDDQASGTTDVRLYYSQSFAYEVVTSGIALLIVLCAQLFWPGQFVLHFLQAQGANLTFELGLTIAHAIWLLANLLLFYQFIVTTLRFVEPDARKRMRDRYTADVAMPRDLASRLLQALYLTAPQSISGGARDEGPDVQLGFGSYFLTQPTTEVEFRFPRPSRLFDVRMKLLAIVTRGWRKRVQSTQPVSNRMQLGGRKWDGELNVPFSFESDLDGPTAWLLREGPVALTRWERFLVRWSFLFTRAEREPRDPITPSDFMGDLTDRLLGQIERSALSGFRTALSELVSYHSFVLATQDTITDAGEPLNFAQVGGAFTFDRPDKSWINLYRRAYFAAASKIDIEPEFIERLGYVARTLLPADARNVSAEVVTALLDVGYYEVVALEAWVTRRTRVEHAETEEAQPILILAGSDRRAYERVLINFIGAWESTLQSGSIVYKWRETDEAAQPVQWTARARAWPFLEAHLRATAYFFAIAVWNEDRIGAERYRDMFLRWLNPFYDELRDTYAFQHPEFLSPDAFGLDWTRAGEVANAFQRAPFAGRLSAKTLTGVLLRAAHDDALVISAAVVLSWRVQGRQSTEIGGSEADAILQRTLIADQGSTLLEGVERIGPFWLALAVLIKHSLGSWLDEKSYPAALNSLVDLLGGMTERRVVPGRIYSGWGAGGVDTVRPFLLAIMGACYPENDAAITAWSDWFVANEQILKQGDRSVRSVIDTARTLEGFLQPDAPEDDFDRALAVLNANTDVAATRAKVRVFFEGLYDRLTTLRTQRLQAAPVDPTKLHEIRNALRDGILAHGPEVYPFHGVAIRRGVTVAAEARSLRFGAIDKGQLVTPSMSDASVEDLASITVRFERENLAGQVWREFYTRPRRVVALDMNLPAVARWQAILTEAPAVGPRPTLFVPWQPFADELSRWMYLEDRPTEFTIAHIDGMPSGGGASYVGTVGGVHVYNLNGIDRPFLSSGEALRTVTYELLPDSDDVVDVSLDEAASPSESSFEIRTAQTLEWSNDEIIEFAPGAAAPAGG